MSAVTEGTTESPRVANEILRTDGLTKHFPLKRSARHPGEGSEIRAVDGVSLSIAAGATLGLVGESGSGKSTIARLVLRLMPVTAGKVFFDGNDVTVAKGEALRALRPKMQLVFQDPYSSFDPQATVFKSVIEPLQAQRRGKADCRTRAEELFDLEKDPGQKDDVAAKHPDVVKKMRAHYDGWWTKLEPVFMQPTKGQSACHGIAPRSTAIHVLR